VSRLGNKLQRAYRSGRAIWGSLSNTVIATLDKFMCWCFWTFL